MDQEHPARRSSGIFVELNAEHLIRCHEEHHAIVEIILIRLLAIFVGMVHAPLQRNGVKVE